MNVTHSDAAHSRIDTQGRDKAPDKTYDRIYYKPSALKKYALLGAVLGSVVFCWTWLCWAGWYAWMYGQQPLRLRSVFVGIILGPPLVLFCVALTRGALRMLLANRPAVEVTNEGITYAPVLGFVKRVSWDAVGSFRIRDEPAPRRKTNAVLEILSSSPFFHDLCDTEHHVLMSIWADGLERSLPEIIASLETSVEAYRRRHGVTETWE